MKSGEYKKNKVIEINEREQREAPSKNDPHL